MGWPTSSSANQSAMPRSKPKAPATRDDDARIRGQPFVHRERVPMLENFSRERESVPHTATRRFVRSRTRIPSSVPRQRFVLLPLATHRHRRHHRRSRAPHSFLHPYRHVLRRPRGSRGRARARLRRTFGRRRHRTVRHHVDRLSFDRSIPSLIETEPNLLLIGNVDPVEPVRPIEGIEMFGGISMSLARLRSRPWCGAGQARVGLPRNTAMAAREILQCLTKRSMRNCE